MEQYYHAIDERTDRTTNRPPGNHRGGENDRITETNEEPHTETNWPPKAPEILEIECKTCYTNVLVPRFEGEKDDQYETKDLPEVFIPGIAAPDPLSVTKNFDLSHDQNPSECHEMFFEGPGVAQDTQIVLPLLDRRSDSFFAVENSPVCQKIISDLYDVAGLTLGVVEDLDRPPDHVLDG